MKYIEYGTEQKEIIIFLHGGGLAPWNFSEEAKQLKNRYHVILPVLHGHNGSDRDFTTIESNADEIIEYIDEKCGGKILMMSGLSLGGQILTEILSKRKDICEFAIIESALVLPMKITYSFIKPTFSFCYPLVKKVWFAKMQSKALHIRKEFFEEYYRDSSAITKENMIAFLKANASYTIKNDIEKCRTRVLVVVGGRESKIMKKSAEIICSKIENAVLEILPEFYHGDLSINHPNLYVKKMEKYLQ
ncbi:MAG: alpha/beta hydrolase [Bacillota bacterium]|nr:alpha/beta hydrolase [Bacillota bacterium]